MALNATDLEHFFSAVYITIHQPAPLSAIWPACNVSRHVGIRCRQPITMLHFKLAVHVMPWAIFPKLGTRFLTIFRRNCLRHWMHTNLEHIILFFFFSVYISSGDSYMEFLLEFDISTTYYLRSLNNVGIPAILKIRAFIHVIFALQASQWAAILAIRFNELATRKFGSPFIPAARDMTGLHLLTTHKWSAIIFADIINLMFFFIKKSRMKKKMPRAAGSCQTTVQ